MQIVELIRLYGRPEQLRQLTAALADSGDLAKIRQEQGCLYFDFFYSAQREDELLLAEKWESAQALAAHHQSPMMAALKELLGQYGFEMRAEQYQVSDRD